MSRKPEPVHDSRIAELEALLDLHEASVASGWILTRSGYLCTLHSDSYTYDFYVNVEGDRNSGFRLAHQSRGGFRAVQTSKTSMRDAGDRRFTFSFLDEDMTSNHAELFSVGGCDLSSMHGNGYNVYIPTVEGWDRNAKEWRERVVRRGILLDLQALATSYRAAAVP